MNTFIRRYYGARSCKVSQKKWKFYKSMAKIMESFSRSGEKRRLSSLSENDSSNETAKLINGKEENKITKKALPRLAKQKKEYSSNKNPVQNVWTVKYEEILLEVWKRHVRTLGSAKLSAGAVKEMESDLHRQGIEVTSKEIQSKILALTRKFREYRNRENADKQWAHYNAVFQILEPREATTSDQQPENIVCFVDVENVDGEECLDLQICKETDDNPSDEDIEIVSDVSETDTKVLSEHLNITQISIASSEGVESVTPDLDESELDKMLKDSSTEDICTTQKPTEISPKTQLTREFGEFVTKELSMLSDDLLIEAKRQIYIICVMQIKQLQANKTALKN